MKVLMGFILFVFVFLVTSCSPKNIVGLQGDGLNTGASADCEPILKAGYKESLWTIMTTKTGKRCSECHTNSGVQSSFAVADPNIGVAFNAFHTPSLPGANIPKIKERMTNLHQSSGDLSTEEVNASIKLWEDSVNEYNICLSQSKDEPGTGPINDPFKAKVFTGEKFLVLSGATQATDIEWDLGRELENSELDGVKLKLEVTLGEDKESGDKWYSFKKPRLIANKNDIEIKSLQVFVNAEPALKQTWKQIHRKVQKNLEQVLGEFELKIFSKEFSTNDGVSLGFVELKTTKFKPKTLTELNQGSGVFAQSCLQCHSGRRIDSGVDLTKRSQLIRNGLVVPFDINASELYLRMLNTQKPMPVSGNLNQESLDQVKDWILGGAQP